MTEGAEEELGAAFRRTGLTTRDAWLRYLALGGNADEVSVAGQLHGLVELPPPEYDVLAVTINEELDDLPEHARGPRVAYRSLGQTARRRPR